MTQPWLEWGLHWRAHRGWVALLAWVWLAVMAGLCAGLRLPLMSIFGSVDPPVVNLLAVLGAGVMVWSLVPRSELEIVSTRALDLVGVTFWWLVALVAAIALALVAPGGVVYLRAVLATLGMTTVAWQRTKSPLSALVPAVWFVLTTAVGRAPMVEYWGFFVVVGDLRTWIIPVLVALLAWIPRRRRA